MISLVTLKRNGLLLGALCGLLLPAISNAQSRCVQLMSASGTERSVPVRLGSALRLSYRHSIYGSQVEEIFTVRRDGFELFQLRYSEARLVDFYGYENAHQENAVWVVTPAPTILSSLNLTLSGDAAMSLHFDQRADAEQLVIHPGSAYRLTVTSCKDHSND